MFVCDNISVNEDGHLTFAGEDTLSLASKYGTPLMLVDEDRIRERCSTYINAMRRSFGDDALPLFASKALCFKRLYEIVADEGMGIDVVSPGEIFTAMQAGFPMSRAYFHGNNKTPADVRYAMECGVGYFICDNMDELDEIDRATVRFGRKQKILLRLTPGIDPHTLAAISTGKVDSKFGVAIETGQAQEFVRAALAKENVELCGFHCHIGSQIFEYKPFCDAAIIMLGFIKKMKDMFGYEARVLNLGGGMGVPYVESQPRIDYAANIAGIGKLIDGECKKHGISHPQILLEPGRSIVADSGMTLYTAGSRKEIPGFKNYVSIDGGMPDNPRYALYEAPYTVLLANRPTAPADYVCTIAGRCCESGDLIAEGVSIPRPERGDIIAVCTTGAYNYAMASNYNRIPRPPIVMLHEGEDYIAVRRESYADMTVNEI